MLGKGRDFLKETVLATGIGVWTMLPYYAAVALCTLLVLGFSWHLDRMDALAHGQYIERFAPIYVMAMVLMAFFKMVMFVVRTHDWATRRRVVANAVTANNAGRLLSGILALFTFVLFLGSFTTFKNLMPDLMGGFTFDRVQADIDRVLHFGYDPGPVLVQVFDSPAIRKAVEWNYSVLWTLIGFLPIFFIAVSARADQIRARYFVTMVAVWSVLGSLLACLFLSAGPVFYAQVTGDFGRFATLLAFMNDPVYSPSSAAGFQAYLWNNYVSGSSSLGTGISAFPSVHVGLAMMHAMYLRDLGRIAGIAGFAYVAIVTMSSVYLGWHYAIDGYVSIAVVAVLHIGLKHVFRPADAAVATTRHHPNPAKA